MNGIMQPDLYYTSYVYCPYVPDWATTFFVFSEVTAILPSRLGP